MRKPDMKKKDYSEEQCPVCGYYCIGKGGFGCIDKPSLVDFIKIDKSDSKKEKECKHEWFLAKVLKEVWQDKEYRVVCKFCLEKRTI